MNTKSKEMLASKLVDSRSVIRLASRELEELLEYAQMNCPDQVERIQELASLPFADVVGEINVLILELRTSKHTTVRSGR